MLPQEGTLIYDMNELMYNVWDAGLRLCHNTTSDRPALEEGAMLELDVGTMLERMSHMAQVVLGGGYNA